MPITSRPAILTRPVSTFVTETLRVLTMPYSSDRTISTAFCVDSCRNLTHTFNHMRLRVPCYSTGESTGSELSTQRTNRNLASVSAEASTYFVAPFVAWKEAVHLLGCLQVASKTRIADTLNTGQDVDFITPSGVQLNSATSTMVDTTTLEKLRPCGTSPSRHTPFPSVPNDWQQKCRLTTW